MDIRHLKTLIAIAEHRSFVGAADAIGLTQSAVSLHVKALEEELNARLFDRDTRPPLLNANGRQLVERAREIVGLCDKLTNSFSGSEKTGTLELGAVQTALSGVLPPALVILRSIHPDLQIRVTSGLSAELADAVRKGNLDVAMVSEPTQLATGLSWHASGQEPLMVIAPKNAKGETDRELLESLPYIRFQRFAWAGRVIDTHIRDRGIQVEQGMEMDSLEAVSMMVSNGLGVSIVPKRPISDPFPGDIRSMPFGEPPVYRDIGLVERTANPKSDLVKALVEVLVQLYST
jgi:DNA-binding transcriptional LysR family regulator